MKTTLTGFAIALFLLCSATPRVCHAVTALNTQYSCTPPFVANSAKPNIHFVLDITGSMSWHPYTKYDSRYYPAKDYYGYFKEDKYYKYDFAANNYWQENTSCTNTDYIGSTNSTTGTCVSGKFLNYATSNKYDIMRKILTGGRPWTNSSGVIQDATVLEHELRPNPSDTESNLSNEPETNCSVTNSTANKTTIFSPNPSTGTVVTTISTSSSSTYITVGSSGGRTTFTRTTSTGSITGAGVYTTDGVVPGTIITTSGFSNSANNNNWVVYSITSNVITVTTNTGVTENLKKSVAIKTSPLTVGPTCKFLVNTVNIPMTVTANNKITRLDTGSFITDGWTAGMSFDADGFATSGNNSTWTIAAGGVSASVLTITATSLTTTASPVNARLTQNLTTYVRVKYATSETPFTGIIQSMYNGYGDAKTKADIEMSFFNDNGSDSVDYTGGSTTYYTVKNQPLVNYINAVNISYGSGGTNTGPAMAEAEKFFQQVAINTSITKPTTGTTLIGPKNGAADPYYDPPTDGSTPTNTNSTASPCRKAFVVLVSDGEWNAGSDPVAPAYSMHTTDMRPDSTQPALSDPQYVTTYTVYAFGDSAGGRNALITTAIFGGFEDGAGNSTSTPNTANNLPYPFTSTPAVAPYSSSLALKTEANTTGYTNSTKVAGTRVLFDTDVSTSWTFPLDECDPGAVADATAIPPVTARATNWNYKCAEWDKSAGATTALPNQRHTGLPYNYFEPKDGSGAALAKAITDAITAIFAKVSSGTAASILSNSEGSGANLLQAVYYPTKVFTGDGAEISWIGEMQNLWYYVDPFIANSSVREDTDGDRKLDLKNDYITSFFFDSKDTKVKTQVDSNGDGVGDSTINSAADPETVKSIWRAGRLLHTRTPDSRKIHTSIDGINLYMGTSTHGGFYYTGDTATDRPSVLRPYLQAATLDESKQIIKYIRGDDQKATVTSPAFRNRQAKILSTDSTATEWKLGDIITSTPRLQSTNRVSLFDLPTPTGYNDVSYGKFITTSDYKSRGMAYVGTNDGMLHAFKLGKLTVSGSSITGFVKATLTGEGTTETTYLGSEQWAFIPRNALPYLRYLTESATFKHLYYVDGSTVIADVAIASGGDSSTACTGEYSQCTKNKTDGSNWRTLLIGSMGLGGASQITGSTACKDYVAATAANLDATCVKTPLLDPDDSSKGLGYSSYFALDITDQHFASDGSGAVAHPPTMKWELADPRLGYSTSGAAILRVSASTTTGSVTAKDKTKNGKSFAVMASGPTGPIIEGSFKARSDQNLKLFVVDLGATGALTEGTNFWVIDTGIKRAFGGSMINAPIDVDRWSETAVGNYQDDALYVGYTKASIADTATITSTTEWNDGGVIRLITKESINPNDWKTSVVVSGTGSVTGGIARLQDRKNHKLWLYFGTGRYFYGGDDKTTQRYIVGVQEPCYLSNDTIDQSCATSPPAEISCSYTSATSSYCSALKSAATVTSCALGTKKGWYIPLSANTTVLDAERAITDPVSLTNGMVQFTTFMPTADVCKFGGNSYIWAVKYDDGCALPSTALNSKVLLQVSTGAFEEVNLSTKLTANDGRKTGDALTGRPPTAPPPIVSNASNKPSKKILHIQEK